MKTTIYILKEIDRTLTQITLCCVGIGICFTGLCGIAIYALTYMGV